MLDFINNDIKIFKNCNFGMKTSRFCHLLCYVITDVIIQLMHSFEVNIRIYQPENSEAETNITFEG